MLHDTYPEITRKMDKTLELLHAELSRIRAGRANPVLLDKLVINYYGSDTPLTQVANVSVPEARQITIQPWDATLVKDIEKAILASDIGITPSNDGKIIRLIFPALTEERRKELTKVVKKEGENSKIAIRSIRRDSIEHFKKDQKASVITEDDLKDAEKDMQELTDKHIKNIDKIIKSKIDEIMEV